MRKLLLTLLLTLPLALSAQTVRFGHVSCDSLLHAMPQYAQAERNLADLRAQYDAEMRRVETEFNTKYEEFLDQQRDLQPTILRKRQAELQEMMQRNVEFRQNAERLLEQARQDAYAPLRQRLRQVLQQIGRQRGYAFILNTDNDACPYIDPALGDDITILALEQLK